ncbi:hypothetical protein [Caballeronia sp. dw_19]|uniref:hypothetical protein n=1 Tax=Caballeronia sp. dw_19 TaxID=2719791 RepID=UPI001BCC9646|nr:hypothetical protein [Caballeronia sp. dw_19]
MFEIFLITDRCHPPTKARLFKPSGLGYYREKDFPELVKKVTRDIVVDLWKKLTVFVLEEFDCLQPTEHDAIIDVKGHAAT